MEVVLKGITKTYGHNTVLSDVNLSVAQGEIRALLGGNGSGKSTMVKILSGVVKPTAGTVEIFGEPYNITGPIDAKKKGVIMTSQELSLLPNLTVAQNISLCSIPKSGPFSDKKKMRETALEVLKELEMDYAIDTPIDRLAPNEKYMVEYAKALVQNPKVLLVDEITSALFKENVEVIKRSMRKLKEQGVAIFFISHRLAEIYDICDTVTVLRNGIQVADLEVAGAEEKTLLSLMTGRDMTAEASATSIAENSWEKGEELINIEKLVLPNFGHEINLTVEKGEIVCVAGLQGHGQSDFIRTLFGINGPVSYKLKGEERTFKDPVQVIKSGIAYLSGDREIDGVFQEQNISENLNAVRQLIFNDNEKNDKELLEKYTVRYADTRQFLTELSGGNQQKVIIGRWLSVKPMILLADDPTKGVDVNARTDVHRLMSELLDAGSSVIIFTSDNDEIVDISRHSKHTTVVVMYEGEIVETLRGSDITEENISRAALAGKKV